MTTLASQVRSATIRVAAPKQPPAFAQPQLSFEERLKLLKGNGSSLGTKPSGFLLGKPVVGGGNKPPLMMKSAPAPPPTSFAALQQSEENRQKRLSDRKRNLLGMYGSALEVSALESVMKDLAGVPIKPSTDLFKIAAAKPSMNGSSDVLSASFVSIEPATAMLSTRVVKSVDPKTILMAPTPPPPVKHREPVVVIAPVAPVAPLIEIIASVAVAEAMVVTVPVVPDVKPIKTPQSRAGELIKRADAMETNGSIAAALGLLKEAFTLFPKDELLQSRITRMQDELLQDDDDDVVGAYRFKPLGVSTPHRRASQPIVVPATPGSSSNNALPSIPTTESKVDMHPILRDIAQRRSINGATPTWWNTFTTITEQLIDAESQSTAQPHDDEDSSSRGPSRVRFRGSCIDPPPCNPIIDEVGFETSLQAADGMLKCLGGATKSCDDLRKSQLKTDLQIDQAMALFWPGEAQNDFTGYIRCTMMYSLGKSKCQCAQSSTCRFKAISARESASRILSSALRACMRRLFNTGKYRVSNNSQDVAAVLHKALLLYHTRADLVDRVVLGLKPSSSSTGTVQDEQSDVAMVGEFVQAHTLLMSLFPSQEVCAEMTDLDYAAWIKLRAYLTQSRELRCEDEMVLLPLAALKTFVEKLQKDGRLVQAVQGHVDAAFKRALRDDSYGQCGCAGAHRRRAAAMGMWIAPKLLGGDVAAHERSCLKCGENVPEKSAQIACECCEKLFHLKCLRFPDTYAGEYVCGTCVKKFKPSKEEEEE